MTRTSTFAAVALVGVLALSGCSSPPAESGAAAEKPSSSPEQPKPADLAGEWVEENAGDSTQSATVTADSISVSWISAKDGTTAVYWVGTYAAPTKPGDFAWTSTRDEAATDSALLASTDSTKEFTYSGGKLSYKVTAMGVTKTMELIHK